MKIIDLIIHKETTPADTALRCLITLESGEQMESVVKWHNDMGIWASSDEARDHAEICAWLRSFAKSIEDAGKVRDAA